MSLISRRNYLLKGLLFYRRIRHNAGHGVHSPFVFSLITKVIKETSSYYRFYDIELIRKQLLLKDDPVLYIDKHNKLRNKSIAQAVKKEAISRKEGALLFRLANYFKAKHILQVGSTMGISTLYLTSYASNTKCISLEKEETYLNISKWVYKKEGRSSVDTRIGSYEKEIANALEEIPQLDLIFLNTPYDDNNLYYFEACSKHIHDKTVLIIKGIKSNRKMRSLWKTICSHPETTVTVDLFSLGIVFFNKKLHKHNYIVYF